MALILALNEGESFYVGDQKVLLEKIIDRNFFVLTIPTGWATQKFEIKDTSRVEILPNVFCQAGYGTQRQVKVLLEAPKHIKLLRSELYEAN